MQQLKRPRCWNEIFYFERVFDLLSYLTSFTNFVFLKIYFGKASNKFIFVELGNEVQVSMSQPPMPQPTLIMHAWKVSIMAIIFWNIYSINIIKSIAYEDGFIILNIFDDAMRCFKNHFKTFVTKLTYAQKIMF